MHTTKKTGNQTKPLIVIKRSQLNKAKAIVALTLLGLVAFAGIMICAQIFAEIIGNAMSIDNAREMYLR